MVPPAEIKFLLAEVEALIGKRIDLPLSVKGLIQEGMIKGFGYCIYHIFMSSAPCSNCAPWWAYTT